MGSDAKMKIVCFHLYNDFSGSPKVLYDVLSGLLDKGYAVDLITSRGGVLDNLDSPKLTRRSYGYRFSKNPIVTMFNYARIQLLTFVIAFRYLFDKDVTFYINTILPLGPAMAGRLTGKRVVYHYHENAFIKSGFYRMLAKFMQAIAGEIICVSKYQASFLSKNLNNIHVIPNALNDKFVNALKPDPEAAYGRKRVLMLSSLKAYKGTKIFLDLAKRLPELNFELVINDTKERIDDWLKSENITPSGNVVIQERIKDVAVLYNRASLVLNLSDPRLVIETFGLTALEAMSCALPVIVPQEGGIAELVKDGENGYKIDCKDSDLLVSRISTVLTDKDLYLKLAENALAFSEGFSQRKMLDSITSLLFR